MIVVCLGIAVKGDCAGWPVESNEGRKVAIIT